MPNSIHGTSTSNIQLTATTSNPGEQESKGNLEDDFFADFEASFNDPNTTDSLLTRDTITITGLPKASDKVSLFFQKLFAPLVCRKPVSA